jgi:hypothetical protein
MNSYLNLGVALHMAFKAKLYFESTFHQPWDGKAYRTRRTPQPPRMTQPSSAQDRAISHRLLAGANCAAPVKLTPVSRPYLMFFGRVFTAPA